MKLPREEFQANDGIDKDDEDDEKSNVKQGNHGHNYTIQHDL